MNGAILSEKAFAMSCWQLENDKELYGKSEEIVSTLKVENTSEAAVSNVSLENLIPEGYKLAKGSEASKQVDSLGAGESASLSVTYAPLTTPKTGDASHIALWLTLMVLVVGGIVVFSPFRKRYGRRL